MKDLYLKNGDLKNYPRLFEDIFHIESTLYKYEENEEIIILKMFDDYMYKKLMQNKEHKISYFQNNNHPYLTNPLFRVYINNYFAGYGMHYFNGQNIEIFSKSLPLKEQINLFKSLSDAIKKAHQDNLILGDVNFNNILTDGKTIKFCDIDSIGTPYSPPITIPYILGNNVNLTENDTGNIYSDLFIVNLMILQIFMHIDMNSLANLSIEEYHNIIKKLKLSSTLNYVFLNLYHNLINKDKLIYPSSYLDELYEVKKRIRN